MSKELAFTDDNDVVKYLDTTTAFNLALTADGVAFDLTNAKSILVKIANDDGYIMQEAIDLTTVTSPLGGTLSFPINQDIMNTLVPDDYDIEVWVTMNDGTQAIFPSDGTLGFSIEENLMSDTGEVIPTVTLNDFQQQFDDLSNQMENAVHNVQKGDKGDKGDTGTGLEIKDKVSSVSNLPSTANEGDGYLVGEELYVWVNGAWKDCGPLQGPKGDQGVQGIQGNTGTGVSSTTIQYQISNSATTAPTGTWSNDIVATTTANPYLWMKATLNYTDGTTKDFYLVSQKGDKGDTGATGATGPIGPQGPVGSGLVVKGTVNDASQLPTTGNQEGYCYFVGTDLYVWDAGAWKNCGSVSPDLSNYVTVTDLNNGLSTKVTDNKDGTEQLNGVQVQPFNKLSDSVGGRNLLINTAQLNDSTVCLDKKSNISDTYLGLNIYQTNNVWDGVRIYWSYLAPKLKTETNYVMSEYVRNTSPTTSVNIGIYGTDSGVVLNSKYGSISMTKLPPNSGWTRISALVNIASFPTTISGRLRFENATTLTDGYVQFAGLKLEQGSIATDWTPAPEDKVNVSDMRKPASDVAGIEEVNAKQDEIGYTPADDSTVAHLSGANNFDTVPTVDNNPLLLASSLPSDLARTGQDTNFTRKLQKSGIDVATTADVSKAVNTATSNVVTTDKPANFTAGLQSGGVSVATSDDLKSVEANAWRVLDQKNLNLGGTLLYKIDQSSKKIYMLCSIECNSSLVNKSIADFSSVVKNITTISGKAYAEFLGSGSVFASISNLSIYDPTSIVVDNLFINGSANVNFSAGAYFTYDSLR
ncbi:MAG: phage baseplate upper protein [Lactobacillus sp.]|nr:phage baseplate upper protein [Lactobacillus sp.]